LVAILFDLSKKRQGYLAIFCKVRADKLQRFKFMKSSTKDKIKGGLREAKGKVKEESGKAIGNPNLRDRGTDEKISGKVQKKIGDVKKVFGK
jgi:uncharacterized protein YjbJ (UPF0337 family)